MQDLYTRLAKDSKWYSEKHPAVTAIAEDWRNWLFSRASLTERLIAFSGDQFEVRVLSQRWGKPLLHEANRLNIPTHLTVRIREVELYCNGVAMVFARSIMPLQVFLDQRHVLANIGTRPLGHLLFKDGQIRVSKRSVSLYQTEHGSVVYGRSTPYRYADKEILVSEFFINPALIS
ncbi:MAG: chorismate--pyruvate lyase [Dinoroseobacter sp.]|jgi:chorismate--pyruvate lyase